MRGSGFDDDGFWVEPVADVSAQKHEEEGPGLAELKRREAFVKASELEAEKALASVGREDAAPDEVAAESEKKKRRETFLKEDLEEQKALRSRASADSLVSTLKLVTQGLGAEHAAATRRGAAAYDKYVANTPPEAAAEANLAPRKMLAKVPWTGRLAPLTKGVSERRPSGPPPMPSSISPSATRRASAAAGRRAAGALPPGSRPSDRAQARARARAAAEARLQPSGWHRSWRLRQALAMAPGLPQDKPPMPPLPESAKVTARARAPTLASSTDSDEVSVSTLASSTDSDEVSVDSPRDAATTSVTVGDTDPWDQVGVTGNEPGNMRLKDILRIYSEIFAKGGDQRALETIDRWIPPGMEGEDSWVGEDKGVRRLRRIPSLFDGAGVGPEVRARGAGSRYTWRCTYPSEQEKRKSGMLRTDPLKGKLVVILEGDGVPPMIQGKGGQRIDAERQLDAHLIGKVGRVVGLVKEPIRGSSAHEISYIPSHPGQSWHSDAANKFIGRDPLEVTNENIDAPPRVTANKTVKLERGGETDPNKLAFLIFELVETKPVETEGEPDVATSPALDVATSPAPDATLVRTGSGIEMQEFSMPEQVGDGGSQSPPAGPDTDSPKLQQGKDKEWAQMDGEERDAVGQLGWTSETWDLGEDGTPFETPWNELGADRQGAARRLGMTPEEFNEAAKAKEQRLENLETFDDMWDKVELAWGERPETATGAKIALPDTYAVGEAVEVYSDRAKEWVAATVTEKYDDRAEITVAYESNGKRIMKRMFIASLDLRKAMWTKEWSLGQFEYWRNSRTEETQREKPEGLTKDQWRRGTTLVAHRQAQAERAHDKQMKTKKKRGGGRRRRPKKKGPAWRPYLRGLTRRSLPRAMYRRASRMTMVK